ncbi:hypothetical protein M0813_28800 [Anaeramoeba flamelloides]|uniref:Uncharacterized protein n=1 Tax=Anaeramoeba flamelloides TaxID=1746091 RepID=A0ABQ8XQD8_9EUKA|nr:hypothetical protein M0813_28800 [Anaeramoeba flamelloides]
MFCEFSTNWTWSRNIKNIETKLLFIEDSLVKFKRAKKISKKSFTEGYNNMSEEEQGVVLKQFQVYLNLKKKFNYFEGLLNEELSNREAQNPSPKKRKKKKSKKSKKNPTDKSKKQKKRRRKN